MLNTFYDCYEVLSKVYLSGAFLKQSLAETFIEEVNRAKTTKICYGVLDKDVTLDYYISRLCDKKPKNSVKIILKIGMYSIKYLETPPYAVVDNLVKLMKKMGKGGASGFVNAVLRKFSGFSLPEIKDKYLKLSVKYSYPLFAVKRLIKDYGESVAVSVMSADEERTTVRFNDGIDGEKYLSERNFNYETTPFENAYVVKNFKRNADYDEGIYTFQSLGSLAICFEIPSGETLLDACSAPGGKSVNLSKKFKEITATDIHPHRVKLIEEYARRMKKSNITALTADSSVFKEEYAEKFDCVLLDAPCSGYGVVKDNPDIKLRRTEEDISELNKLQKKLIKTVSRYVKKGGYLCYSTCSVFKSENEDICKAFLDGDGEYEEVKTNSPLPHISLSVGTQFLPNISLGAGFYLCLMKKKI